MLTLLALGDYGADTEIRRQNTRMMREHWAHADATLGLGDNFYDWGVDSAHDPQWRSFETSFQPSRPFYAVLGNHDYLGSIDAQTTYQHHHPDSFWRMPSRYYDRVFADGLAHVFFLDTFTLCPHESLDCSLGMGRHGLGGGARDDQQYQWLNAALKRSTATWKIVVGHYPVFSSGLHGDTDELVRDLYPLLRRHDVDFYLSGHDHDLEFVRRGDVNFIVSGTGSFSTPTRPSEDTVHASDPPTHGFAVLQLTPTLARFGFHTNHRAHDSWWWSVPKHKNIFYRK